MNTVSVPKNVELLLKKLTDGGFRADIVGGCVRDMLLGLIPHDFDITTDATPEEMKRVFEDLRTVDTGIKHGTLTVLLDGEPYEITTYRVDGAYADHRHPSGVSFTRRLADDLARRDFTVNAMCYHPSYGVTDLFSGREDLDARIIRCVGDARLRFEEDALRMLRALRFASTLGFSIAPDTAAAIHEKRHLLRAVSAERTCGEIKRLFVGKDAVRILTEYREILDEILPFLHGLPIKFDIFDRLPTFSLRFCSMFAQLSNGLGSFEKACDALRVDNELRRMGSKLLPLVCQATGDRRSLLDLLNTLGETDAERLLQLRYAVGTDESSHVTDLHALLLQRPVYRVCDLAVRGDDLLALGMRGRVVGVALSRALDAVMDGTIKNEREDLLMYLRKEATHGI